MTPNEKDYMDRYIYQVIRRLPKAQRDEVRMELEELISDMYTDKGSMEEVLTELGDPAEFAKQYQSDQRYLIGPEYFDTYLWFVKVVLICAAIPILVISLINAIGEMPAITAQNSASVIIRAIVDGLITGITDAILSCVSAFGAVTLTFAIMERKKVQFELKKAERSEEHTFDLPSFQMIRAASNGDIEAINAVLKHYEGYIAALSTRKMYDENRQVHYCVDEKLRRRLETKLITKILAFEI